MPARGLIYIMASTVEVEGMRMVDLSVTDNGVGLDVEEPVKIFQRYYTTKSVRGHGIGLHWSANVVTSMGGHLFARSGGKGRGTRSEEHTSELQSLMRNSYAVFCLHKNKT